MSQPEKHGKLLMEILVEVGLGEKDMREYEEIYS
jgi:hypothetical protein